MVHVIAISEFQFSHAGLLKNPPQEKNNGTAPVLLIFNFARISKQVIKKIIVL